MLVKPIAFRVQTVALIAESVWFVKQANLGVAEWHNE
jgi:hypothetical protein